MVKLPIFTRGVLRSSVARQTRSLDLTYKTFLRCCAGSATEANIEHDIDQAGGRVRIAIVGAGPAGFYTAQSIMKDFRDFHKLFHNKSLGVQIDVLDRNPVGNGLVRSGVAPDHPEVKHVQHRFQEILEENNEDPFRMRFYGNVNIARSDNHQEVHSHHDRIHVSLPALRNCYHATVFSCGSEGERRLNIPGNQLQGVKTAGSFVRYYNAGLSSSSLPNQSADQFVLSPFRRIAVIGHGNVALDVARIILKGPDALNTTDITEQTLDLLRQSTVNEVHIFGRRGPAQASFTNKELRELFDLEGCTTYIAEEDLIELNNASAEEVQGSRQHKRMIDMMKKKCTLLPKRKIREMMEQETSALEDGKRCFIHFHSNPVTYLPAESEQLGGLVLEGTELVGEKGAQKAVGTGETWRLAGCGMSLESIGYYPLPLHGVPFNEHGLVDHHDGRILSKEGTPMEGLYASGWFKRGPSGIIGTNVWDAQETARSLTSDLMNGVIPLTNKQPFYHGLMDLLEEKKMEHLAVPWSQWMSIEAEEARRGAQCSPPKPSEKFLTSEEMLQVKQ